MALVVDFQGFGAAISFRTTFIPKRDWLFSEYLVFEAEY